MRKILFIAVMLLTLSSNIIFSQSPTNNTSDDIILEDESSSMSSSTPVPKPAPIERNASVLIKRDPFRPVLMDIGFTEESIDMYDVRQLELIGIIFGVTSPKAMFRTPDNKKYILKKGDRIGRNGGVIMQIDKGQVVILERLKTIDGQILENSIVKSLKNST